ncbi:hypothetical protein BDV59DRAFT_171572 [Aspergillus ambiguus]|uniref:zinc knuckle domain protein n=1 Tax=Aspergillus ambiguus TaxID=176160 RepID=UPI003CCDFFE5
MSDSPGDDHDSRTASVGVQRNTRGNSNDSSRPGSIDSGANPRKRQRRNGRSSTDSRDIVPQGASFSANPLEVDPDSTSSSGSDSSDTDDSDLSSKEGSPDAGQDTVPTVNWNQGARSAIRTSLSSRKGNAEDSKSSARFDAVNGKYWRSRSESVSSEERTGNPPEKVVPMEEGQVSEDGDSSDSGEMQLSGESDDSSLDSEADDSIMLNIGSRNQAKNSEMSAGDGDDYDPEALPVSRAVNGVQNGTVHDPATDSKEDVLRRFSQKYPVHPSTLADLNQSDMDIQARSVFYDRNIHDINLQLPVACTECLREGHLAEVCPFKECVHCGAWNKHQSSFCPQWRRCQRCRERGHDEQQCASPLKSSAAEIPCDLCGSSDHLELECDFMWKLPRQDPSSGPVLVSISCAHCTSTRHLVGDCPQYQRKPILSSSWTLRGIDPHMVTNINSVVSGRPGAGGANGQRGGMKIRGRADRYPGSSDSEDLMSRPDRRPPMGRNANSKPNIRIGNGIGKNKNLAPAGSRPPDMGSRQTYRDRQGFPSGNARQRSLSPDPRPGRGRGRGGWQSRARSPPQGRPKPPSNSRGAPRGGRGGGRGGKRGGGDAYRPMPSAAKKAWDKYRL